MHTGSLVFAQLMSHLPMHVFHACVTRPLYALALAGRFFVIRAKKNTRFRDPLFHQIDRHSFFLQAIRPHLDVALEFVVFQIRARSHVVQN